MSEKVHKASSNHTIHIQNQVRFLDKEKDIYIINILGTRLLVVKHHQKMKLLTQNNVSSKTRPHPQILFEVPNESLHIDWTHPLLDHTHIQGNKSDLLLML